MAKTYSVTDILRTLETKPISGSDKNRLTFSFLHYGRYN